MVFVLDIETLLFGLYWGLLCAPSLLGMAALILERGTHKHITPDDTTFGRDR
jgi:hypothetical protein